MDAVAPEALARIGQRRDHTVDELVGSVVTSADRTAAVEDSLDLTIEDWRQLGFRRIAESPFVFRDQLKLNPYDQSPTDIQNEVSYTCDGCGEEVVVPLDLSQGSDQEFVEDCPCVAGQT